MIPDLPVESSLGQFPELFFVKMVLVIAICYNNHNYKGEIMEFEDNRPTSDADRRLAEAKKLTLQPLHTGVAPEAPTDSEIAARHVNEPAIANVSTDTEEETSRMRPTQSAVMSTPTATTNSLKQLAGFFIGAGVFVALIAFALLK